MRGAICEALAFVSEWPSACTPEEKTSSGIECTNKAALLPFLSIKYIDYTYENTSRTNPPTAPPLECLKITMWRGQLWWHLLIILTRKSVCSHPLLSKDTTRHFLCTPQEMPHQMRKKVKEHSTGAMAVATWGLDWISSEMGVEIEVWTRCADWWCMYTKGFETCHLFSLFPSGYFLSPSALLSLSWQQPYTRVQWRVKWRALPLRLCLNCPPIPHCKDGWASFSPALNFSGRAGLLASLICIAMYFWKRKIYDDV